MDWPPPPLHGGPDALGVPRHDFSTNANACGPAPMALEQVRQVDVRRYPDPSHAALRQQLARLHGVEPARDGGRIDIQAAVRRGQAVPAQSPLMPGTTGYDPAFRSSMSAFDPARARAMRRSSAQGRSCCAGGRYSESQSRKRR